MRTKEEVVTWLTQVLVDQFDVKRDAIAPHALLGEDFDLDSIDSIDFAVTLEEATGATVDEDELRGLRSFQDMVDLVCRKLATE